MQHGGVEGLPKCREMAGQRGCGSRTALTHWAPEQHGWAVKRDAFKAFAGKFNK